MASLLIWVLFAGGSGTDCLARATEALDAFRVPAAVRHLECAQKQGPYRHADYVHLYEQWGIALAYLGKNDRASAAFDMLLTLEPGYALSYTLSPKATFLFEQARERAKSRPRPWIDVTWPRDRRTTDPIPVDVAVASDPEGFLKTATLYSRRKGAADFSTHDLVLRPPGEYVRLRLPPVALELRGPQVLELFLVASDAKGNEVLLVGDPERPREIPLAYQEPTPWYRRWWVWALAGGAVAAGVGVAVGVATHEPPSSVPGSFGIRYE